MSAQGENEVAINANWSQRINKEVQGALDWYKEWGIIFTRETGTKPPSVDDLIKQREAELRKYVPFVRQHDGVRTILCTDNIVLVFLSNLPL